MTKLIAKIAEKYAKATNNACLIIGVIHQPKKATSNKDNYWSRHFAVFMMLL